MPKKKPTPSPTKAIAKKTKTAAGKAKTPKKPASRAGKKAPAAEAAAALPPRTRRIPIADRLIRRKRQFAPERDQDGQYTFLDEFIQLLPFDEVKPNIPPPSRRTGNAPWTAADVLGAPFNHAPSGQPGYHFDRYLRLLMDRCRDYNRALYRLRRAHFINEFDPATSTEPMDELPDETLLLSVTMSPEDFESTYHKIEAACLVAFENLGDLLRLPIDIQDPLTGEVLHVSGEVDCVRVNDYIVSVRACANARGRGNANFELPYSSSSLTSISSGFSSYSSLTSFSSSSSWQANP